MVVSVCLEDFTFQRFECFLFYGAGCEGGEGDETDDEVEGSALRDEVFDCCYLG